LIRIDPLIGVDLNVCSTGLLRTSCCCSLAMNTFVDSADELLNTDESNKLNLFVVVVFGPDFLLLLSPHLML